MKFILYTLSMPRVNTWNNKWSGENKGFYVVRKYLDGDPALKNIQTSKFYNYDFGDGWSARIDTNVIEQKSVASYRKKSAGFMDYDWMIDEIESHGRILRLEER